MWNSPWSTSMICPLSRLFTNKPVVFEALNRNNQLLRLCKRWPVWSYDVLPSLLTWSLLSSWNHFYWRWHISPRQFKQLRKKKEQPYKSGLRSEVKELTLLSGSYVVILLRNENMYRYIVCPQNEQQEPTLMYRSSTGNLPPHTLLVFFLSLFHRNHRPASIPKMIIN